MLAPMASHDAYTNANDITWSVSHVAPHYHCPDLRNLIVALMVSLALHNTNASATNIKYLKSHVVPHIDSLHLGNTMVPFIMS